MCVGDWCRRLTGRFGCQTAVGARYLLAFAVLELGCRSLSRPSFRVQQISVSEGGECGWGV